MPRDARLESAEYFDGTFNRRTKLNFQDLFQVPTGRIGEETPWNLGHFTSSDFVNRVRARERVLNPAKGFVNPDNPQESEAFVGIGRFNPDDPSDGYDFTSGRPLTRSFREDPDYDPLWEQKFNLSPVRNPKDDLTLTMPNMKNPDPQNFLAMRAQEQAKQDTEGPPTAEEVVKSKQFTKEEEAKAGNKVEAEEEAKG